VTRRSAITAVPDDARGVEVKVTGPLVHECPHRDETDHGTVTITWRVTDVTLEIHSLRKYLDSWRRAKVSHEAITAQVFGDIYLAGVKPIVVTTTWNTGGMQVSVQRGAAAPEVTA
jgi:NADPH-dependent 7-cyano-7-deazaguanine reductase QueF